MSKKINSNRAGTGADVPFIAFSSDAMPPLRGDTGADVCIVGASFVGLRTAYDLLQKGKSVVLIESGALLPERGDDGQRATLHELLAGDSGEAPSSTGYTPATSSEMAHAIVQLGGRIHGGTRALAIRPEHNMQVVDTTQGAIVARVVVLATAPAAGGGDNANSDNNADSAEPGPVPALRILTTPAPGLDAHSA
jgi:glycine/D-amino acid oxidase-like deaminating enzyme